MDTLYCIEHESMEIVEFGEITGQPLHQVMIGGGMLYPEVDWCEGPFASCPPPEIGEDYWDVVFAQEAE